MPAAPRAPPAAAGTPARPPAGLPPLAWVPLMLLVSALLVLLGHRLGPG